MKNKLLPITTGIALALINGSATAKSTIGGIVFTNVFTENNEIKDSAGNTTSDLKKTRLEVADNSRFRVRWDNEDNVSMYVEMAVKNSDNTVRHAYGKWDFSETGQLLAGQTSTPFAPLNPNVAMVNNSGDNYGNINAGRLSQVRYTYKFLNRQGALAVALVDPTVKNAPNDAESETTLPRLDMGLAYKTFDWQLFPSLFIAKQSFEGEDDVTATGISIGAKTAVGSVTFATEIGAGQNWGNTTQKIGGLNNITDATKTAGEDADVLQYWMDIGFRFTGDETKGAIHFIYGFSGVEKSNSVDTESTMIGLSMPIDLPWIARGFRIRPEIFTFEDKDNNTAAETSNTIAGVQLQYTF